MINQKEIMARRLKIQAENNFFKWVKKNYKGHTMIVPPEKVDLETNVYFKIGNLYYGLIKKDILIQKFKQFGLEKVTEIGGDV